MGAASSPDEPGSVVTMRPVLLRRRDAAAALAVSESQVLAFERAGLLKPIKIPGIRAVRLAAADVEALAERWRRGLV